MRRDDVEDGAAVLVAGGDVEEAELVGAGGVIGARRLDRIAGVGEIDEADALDDAAVLDVEAGDDADLQHHGDLRASRMRPQRLGRVEPAVIERAAGDGAFEDGAVGLEQALDVGERGEAARGDHRDRDGAGERQRRRDVEALQHAVAVDVGVDDRGDAGVLEAAGEIDGVHLGRLGPALHRDRAAARVDADGDRGRDARLRGLADEAGIADRGGAEDDAGDALAEPGLDRGRSRMPPPSWTGSVDRGEDRLDRGAVDRAAGEGAVEVDDVQPLEAVPRRRRAPARPGRR